MDKPAYIIGVEETMGALQVRINNFIDEGYVPVGGLTVRFDPNDGRTTYYQALVRADVLRGDA